MDGSSYTLDPYRLASAGYYAPRYPPSYALERRSSYGLPSADPYARGPVESYGAPLYQPDIVLQPRYISAPVSPPFRSRPRPTPKTKGPPSHNLGPKKKIVKQTQKVRFSEEKERNFAKKDTDRNGDKASPGSQAASLVKETKDLHNLFRTGVDSNKGVTTDGKKGGPNGTSNKRKAGSEMQKLTPTKNSKISKKQKGKEKKKLAKEEEAKVKKAEASLPTEEEWKEAEAALEMQRGLCKSVSVFLGIPETKEVSVADGVEADGKVKDSNDIDKDATKKKAEEPQHTPEEEKELEAKSFKFFSSMFVDNTELRNLYIDKCSSGSFECLVCRGADGTRSRKFWNIASLVMHTKMRKQLRAEHAGYGRSVSAVLGWDHEKTPKVPPGARPAAFSKKAADQGAGPAKQEDSESNPKAEKGSECPAGGAKEE